MKKKKDNKTKWIHIRCSEGEYMSLIKKSKGFKSLSSYIRELLFTDKKLIIEPSALIESFSGLTTEIKKIGNNINQLARYVNYSEKIKMESTDPTVLSEIRDILSSYTLILEEIDEKYLQLLKKT